MRRAISVYGLIFPMVFALAFAVQWQRTDAGRDTAILYVGAANPRVGQSIYHPLPEPGVFRQQSVYNYPPPLAAALQPLTYLDYVTFARVWLIVLSVAFWAFAAGCSRILVGRYAWRSALAVGGLLFFAPGVMHSWNMGNADLIVWACVALGLAHAGAARGGALMAASLLKVTPIWAAVCAMRDRRALGGALAAFAFAGVVTLAALGTGAVGESLTFLARVAPTLGQGEWWITGQQAWSILGHELPALSPGNLSLAFLPLHSFRDVGVLPGWARVWLAIAGVGFPLLAGWALRNRPEMQPAGVLAVSVLFAPILRISYLPMLVPCVLVWWMNRSNLARAGRPARDLRQ